MTSSRVEKMLELLDTLVRESDQVLQIASKNASEQGTDKVSWEAVENDIAKVSGKIDAVRDYVKTRGRE